MELVATRTQHVLWRTENMKLSGNVKCVVIHCGTNNIDRDKPKEIANGIILIGKKLQEQKCDLNIIFTGLLPHDLFVSSKRREKIIKINEILKRSCTKLSKFTFIKQDNGWTLNNGRLDEKLYYTDYLHLNEKGNIKFANEIIINRAASGVDLYHFRSFFFPDTTYQTFFSIIFSLGSQGPGSRSHVLGVLGHAQVPGSKIVPGSWVLGLGILTTCPKSRGIWVQVPGSKVLGPR